LDATQTAEPQPRRRSTDNEEPEIQTVSEREFCKRVGISVPYAFELRKAGKLAHYRVGKRVLYRWPDHARELLEANERKKKIA
jgi:hypothetical protein